MSSLESNVSQNAVLSNFMGAALGTPETSQPAPSDHPDMDKPHAYEFGRMDHEGRFKVVIEHRQERA